MNTSKSIVRWTTSLLMLGWMLPTVLNANGISTQPIKSAPNDSGVSPLPTPSSEMPHLLPLENRTPPKGGKQNRVIVKLKAPLPDSITSSSTADSQTGDSQLDATLKKLRAKKFTPLLAGEAFNQQATTAPEMAQAINSSDLASFYVVELPPRVNAEKAVKRFTKLPSVEFAEVDHLAYATLTPNDTLFTLQWGLKSSSGIKAQDAWNISTGTSDKVLAVVDSGVDWSHSDLSGKVTNGYDFVNNDPFPMDDYGHGTHVAGIAAANTSNSHIMAGVCWHCRIMPIKVLNGDGDGYYSWVAQGIIYASLPPHKADVINLSLGGPSDSLILKIAVQFAYLSGVTVVAAAGNEWWGPVLYPAQYPETCTVSATDNFSIPTWFTSAGPAVDLAAPGLLILSTIPNNGVGSDFAQWNGTSMAAPHVTGAVGLMLSINPSLTPNETCECLKNSATDVPFWPAWPGPDMFTGAGRLNLEKALIDVSSGSC